MVVVPGMGADGVGALGGSGFVLGFFVGIIGSDGDGHETDGLFGSDTGLVVCVPGVGAVGVGAGFIIIIVGTTGLRDGAVGVSGYNIMGVCSAGSSS